MPILTLQYLRGIAALMVVMVHLQTQVERMGYQGPWPEWMFSGVDIFFVLSGFLMWSTTADRAAGTWDFWKRRLVRIVPLYWAVTSFAVAVLLAAPQLMQSTRFGLWNVIASYLFVFMPNPAGRMEPVVVVGWTLNYEMLFYLVFGLALVLPAARRFWAVAAVLGGLVLAGAVVPAQNPWWAAYTSSIMLEFVFGMALAWWHARSAVQPARAAIGWLLLCAGFLALAAANRWAPDAPRALAQGLPAMAIVAGALLLERTNALQRQRWLEFLGDASYSLYLSHPIVLSAFAQVWRKLGLAALPGGVAAFGIAAVLACIAVGALLYLGLERPLVRFFRRRAAPARVPAGHLHAGP